MTGVDRRIMVVLGTRAEAVKLAPVVRALQQTDHLEPVLVCSGQHHSLASPFLDHFGLEPHVRLNGIDAGTDLSAMMSQSFRGLSEVVRSVDPAMVVVQGDTTTTVAGALAAFHQGVPIAHVEAGLRSHDLASPYPEEGNRRLVTRLATLHLAPTTLGVANLRAEGVPDAGIVPIGNTVIDSLLEVMAMGMRRRFRPPDGRAVVLLTAHRRESWGEPIHEVALAVADVARARPDLMVAWPVHPNPIVRRAVIPVVQELDNVVVMMPVGYCDFVDLVMRSDVIVTDSGGLQEEAAYLGKPVLVLRSVTERPEAVHAGIARLVGTDRFAIASEIVDAVDRGPAGPSYRYGDGYAGPRAAEAIAHYFRCGPRPAAFVDGVHWEPCPVAR